MKYSLTREPMNIKLEDKYEIVGDYLVLSLYDGKQKVFSSSLDFTKITPLLEAKCKDIPEKQKEASYQKGLDDISLLIYTKFMDLFFSYGDVKKEIEKLIKGGDPIKLV